MMGELEFDNWSEEQIEGLFDETGEENNDGNNQEPPKNNPEEIETKETTEIDTENLFSPVNQSEGVGSEDNNENGQGTAQHQGSSSSPNFYSSIAAALKNDGALTELEETDSIKTAEDFTGAVNKVIQARLSEQQKRVLDALNGGASEKEIRYYENAVSYLDSITAEKLKNEENEGVQLRQNLIYQDYINKGFTEERAAKEVKRIFDAGTDIEYAEEALAENKKYFNEEYKKVIKRGQDSTKAKQEEQVKQSEELKKAILESEKAFGDLEINATTRQKVYEAVTKPVWKDPETGKVYTEVQKYAKDHKNDYLKSIGLLYTLTDGFKTLDKLVEGKVVKKTNAHVKDLENKLNNTRRDFSGNINFAQDTGDTESFFKGLKLDL